MDYEDDNICYDINSIFYKKTLEESISIAERKIRLGQKIPVRDQWILDHIKQEQEEALQAPPISFSLPSKSIPNRNKGKKPKKYSYTLADISHLTNRTIKDIYNDINRKLLIPSNLASVIQYISNIQLYITNQEDLSTKSDNFNT